MDEERLEEIKRQVRDFVRENEQEDIWEIANELITAYEASQQQLAKARDGFGELSDECQRRLDIIVALRKQLAEAQAEVERLRGIIKFRAGEGSDHDPRTNPPLNEQGG